MKLKFETEVQEVITAVSMLPDTAIEEPDTRKAANLIGGLDRSLIQQRDNKTLPMKKWVKLRRQLSFMWEIMIVAVEASKHLRDPNAPHVETDASRAETYRLLVKVFKEIESGAMLKQHFFVRLAINYGVLHLSGHEIQNLIDHNKIS